MPSLSVLQTAVRRLCGDPDVEEISVAAINSFIDTEALEWLNKRKPGEALSSFTTVAGTQDNDAKPANAYRVTKVFWMDSGYDVFSPSLRYFPTYMGVDENLAGFSIVDNPALVEMEFKKMSQYEGNFQGTGIETDEGKIRLEPIPGSTGDTVYFFYTYPRWTVATIADVDAGYVEGLKLEAAALCLEYLAIKRGIVVSGRDFSGGAGRNETVASEKYHERAEGKIPAFSSVFVRG